MYTNKLLKNKVAAFIKCTCTTEAVLSKAFEDLPNHFVFLQTAVKAFQALYWFLEGDDGVYTLLATLTKTMIGDILDLLLMVVELLCGGSGSCH